MIVLCQNPEIRAKPNTIPYTSHTNARGTTIYRTPAECNVNRNHAIIIDALQSSAMWIQSRCGQSLRSGQPIDLNG